MAKKFTVGADLGGTNLKIAVLDSKYKIVEKEILNTRKFRIKKDLILAITAAVSSILERNNLAKNNILGLGLGLPGLVDSNKGIVHILPNIHGWKEVALRSILERKLKLKVVIDNDAKLMALAEYKMGAGKNSRNALCLTLGTGVGGGIILEGKLYRGSNNASGEIGHLPINEEGPLCNCGGRACLESYIGNNRILAQAKKIFGKNITLEELSALAENKNRRALAVWNKVGERLGIALAAVVNLLDLDTIVIGGGVSGAGAVLFKKIRQTINERAMSVQAAHVKVFKAKLGNDAGLMGAALLVNERVRK